MLSILSLPLKNLPGSHLTGGFHLFSPPRRPGEGYCQLSTNSTAFHSLG